MSTTAEVQAPETNYRQRALEKQVVLLSPTMGVWEGRYQLPKRQTDVEISGKRVVKGVSTPRSNLMTDEWPVDSAGIAWKKRFQTLVSRKDSLIDAVSEPFPIRGVRIVPRVAATKLFRDLFGMTLNDLLSDPTAEEQVNRIRQLDPSADGFTPIYDLSRESQSVAYDFYHTTLEFLDYLPEVFRQIQDNIEPELWDAIKNKLPQLRWAMRGKFHIDIVPVAIPGGNDPTKVTIAELEGHEALVQEACRRKTEEAIESLVAGPREKLADALINLKELIDRDGRVTDKSFRPVRDAIAKVRLFSFVANDELMRQIAVMESRLAITTPTSLTRVTAAQTGFITALDNLMGEVQDATRQSQLVSSFGRELRSIQI